MYINKYVSVCIGYIHIYLYMQVCVHMHTVPNKLHS